jgi:predicted enzyme related to lactoylglutathione lyase
LQDKQKEIPHVDEQAPFLCWVEIPITDVDRALKFYSALLGKTLETTPMGPDMTYVMLPMGALVKSENLKPSADGTTVYFGTEDVAVTLARAVKAGGTTVIPKTAIGEASPGYFGQFLDLEGNRVGLYSME